MMIKIKRFVRKISNWVVNQYNKYNN